MGTISSVPPTNEKDARLEALRDVSALPESRALSRHPKPEFCPLR